MFRQLLLSALALLFLLPALSPLGTVAYFNLNREYIARTLCENRAKPALMCNGRCFLAKKLKEQQERQAKNLADELRQLPVVTLFKPVSYRFLFRPAFGFIPRVPFPDIPTPACKNHFRRLLRPPRALAAPIG